MSLGSRSRVNRRAWRPVQVRTRSVWRRLKRNRLAMLGLAIIVVFIGLAVFAPWIAPYDPTVSSLGNA